MKGIVNSELDTSNLTSNEISHWLQNQEYLISIMQRNFFQAYKYDIEDVRFENITPARYRQVMQEKLQHLENLVFEALIKVENDFCKELEIPFEDE